MSPLALVTPEDLAEEAGQLARVSRDEAGRDLISEQEMLAELHSREEI